MTFRECIRIGSEQLTRAMIQCADPRRHMQQIIEHFTGLSPSELVLRQDDTVEPKDRERIEAFLKRRCEGEPFQYIVGHEWFWNWSFKVGPGVFIPRKETEILVECVLDATGKKLKVAELGAGSGILGITLLKERPEWDWFGFEKNSETLPYLKENLQTLLPEKTNYHLIEADFFDRVEEFGPYDAIITNPPYVPRRDLSTLPKEVRQEPALALDGGDWGLEVLERIVEVGQRVLKEGGLLATEMDPRQEKGLQRLLENQGYEDIQFFPDYTHRTRVAMARKVR